MPEREAPGTISEPCWASEVCDIGLGLSEAVVIAQLMQAFMLFACVGCTYIVGYAHCWPCAPVGSDLSRRLAAKVTALWDAQGQQRVSAIQTVQEGSDCTPTCLQRKPTMSSTVELGGSEPARLEAVAMGHGLLERLSNEAETWLKHCMSTWPPSSRPSKRRSS